MAAPILVKSTNGTTVSISAGLPGTPYSSTEYALLTFTAVGEITACGELKISRNMLTHQKIGADFPEKLSDTYDIGDWSLEFGHVASDTGQDLVILAAASKNSYSYKILRGSGVVQYFTGKIKDAGLGAITPSGVDMYKIGVAVDANSLVQTGT